MRYESHLCHHGVKGQKWGVRRYQNQNGSLTAAGRKQYSKSKKTDDDLTTEQRKAKLKKAAVIGASAVAVGLAVWGAYKLSNSRSLDRTIELGKDFYRMGHENEASKGLNQIVYATIKKSDNNKYAKLMSDAKQYKIQSSKKVKIAGTKNAEKIYKELLKTNSSFAEHYGNMSYKDFNGGIGYANNTLVKNGINVNDTYMKPFFDALTSKGYDAIVDTQDQFAKIPVILLNMSDTYSIK